MNIDFNSLAKLIDDSRDRGVDFGDHDSEVVPTEDRIRETECLLGCRLPPSYLWFLKNFGGGEVYGEEIYSIYPELSYKSVGDVYYQTKLDRIRGFVKPDAVVVSTGIFGETFYMDSSMADQDGEFPVFVKTGEVIEIYAGSFAEFLRKRILDQDA